MRCAAWSGATTAPSSPAATWSPARAAWTSSSSGCRATSSTPSRRASTPSWPPPRDVRVAVLPRDEAFAIPDLIRTKVNLLPEGIAEIRTIEIVGLDLQADGGTHVANTREVGGIRVTGYECKGRINKRIRIALEDPAPA